MTKTFSAASHNGKVHPARVRQAAVPETPKATAARPPSSKSPSSTRLSVNIGLDLSERLRLLAHTHRLSESSIVEVALGMFIARGDDAALGVLLRTLGATLRRK